MKVRKLAWPLVLLCFVVTACEEKPEGEAAGEPAAPAEGAKQPAATGGDAAAKPADPNAVAPAKEMAPPTPPPAEVCTSLINAIKAKDEAKVMMLSTPSTTGALGAEGAKDYVMMTLGAATCGAAKVEADAATVAITSGETSQDVPFVKADGAWKFDGAAYLGKYPPPAPDKTKGKGAKAKDHGKGKGAKAKKHKK